MMSVKHPFKPYQKTYKKVDMSLKNAIQEGSGLVELGGQQSWKHQESLSPTYTIAQADLSGEILWNSGIYEKLGTSRGRLEKQSKFQSTSAYSTVASTFLLPLYPWQAASHASHEAAFTQLVRVKVSKKRPCPPNIRDMCSDC